MEAIINKDYWKDKVILVVEDDEMSFIFIRELLSESGVKIVRAENGKQAVELCDIMSFDIVLMDIQLPVMNGYEAVREIKKHDPVLPVIAQTSYGTIEDRKKCMDAGFDDYISKPVKSERIIQVVEQYLYVGTDKRE